MKVPTAKDAKYGFGGLTDLAPAPSRWRWPSMGGPPS
jgi:hypothetical protein